MPDAYAPLAARLGYGDSPTFRRVLQVLMDATQATIAVRLPGDPAQIGTEAGCSAAQVEAATEDMYQRGILFPTSKGWFFTRDVMQLHDATQSDPRQDARYAGALFAAWNAFCEAEWYDVLAQKGGAQDRAYIRVIPHWSAIKDLPGVLPAESMPALLSKATTLAVVPCPCRRRVHACDRDADTCLQAEGAARYAIKRGTGRSLTYEQALVELDRIEQAGLVHQVGNVTWESTMPSVLCNCCADCCVAMKPYIAHDILPRTWAKSRFEATIDAQACTGCQICVDRCNFDAITMQTLPGSRRLKAVVSSENCYGCGACVTGCDEEAASMRLVRPVEHIPAGR